MASRCSCSLSVKMTVVEFSQETLSKFRPFVPIIEPADFLTHAVRLLLLGFVCVVTFVAYQVINSTSNSRSLVKEFSMAASASVLIGMGSLLAMLGLGLYV